MSHKFKDRVRKDRELKNLPQGHDDPQAQGHQQQEQEEAAFQINDHLNPINQENPDNQQAAAAAAGAAIQEDVYHQNYQEQLHGAAALPQYHPLPPKKRLGTRTGGRNKEALSSAALIQNPPVPTPKRTRSKMRGRQKGNRKRKRSKMRGGKKGNVGRHQLGTEAHLDEDEYESYESSDPSSPEDDFEEDPSYYESPCKEDTPGSKRRRRHDDDKDPPAKFNTSFRSRTPKMRSTSVK